MPTIHATKGALVLISSSAKMPASCKGRYARLAILELDPAFVVSARLAGTGLPAVRIDPRDKRVKRIRHLWEPLHVGSTERCEFARFLADARRILAEEA